MPLGDRALNPDTPYIVYAFSRAGKVFYIGIAHGEIRPFKRWGHVRNLVRHEDAGTLKPGKGADLHRLSNQVLAAMIRAGLDEHEVGVLWEGRGKANSEAAEALIIREKALEGCLLANVAGNPRPQNLHAILEWLDVPGPVPRAAFDATG